MTHYFLDSSALVKRYIAELGTGWIRSLVSSNSGNLIIVAQVSSVEIVSGISRRKREGTIAPRTALAIRRLLDRHIRREYRVIELTAQITQRAEDLLDVRPLRAYDAIQLASALESNTRIVAAGASPLIFVSADARLLTAATAEGLLCDDPNAHP